MGGRGWEGRSQTRAHRFCSRTSTRKNYDAASDMIQRFHPIMILSRPGEPWLVLLHIHAVVLHWPEHVRAPCMNH